MEAAVSKMTRSGSAYYAIGWSRLLPLEKDVVIRKIPSEAGIYEVYRYDGGRTASIIGRSRAYYGGLRNTLRGLIDPISPYPLNGNLLDLSTSHMFRYSLLESSADMDDVLFFFAGRDEYEDADQEHSGRYEFIYVKEQCPDPLPDEIVPAEI